MSVPVAEKRVPAAALSLPATGRLDVAAVAVPALLAAVLASLQISSRSLGFDEAATVAIASQHGSALWAAIAHDGGNMSGYYLLMHVLIGLLGNSPLVLRLPSAVAMVATVACVGTIGLRLANRRAALIAGLLTAVSLPVIYWAQTARGYALMLAFVCAGFLAFLSLADELADRQRARRAGRLYAAAMILACYCSFVAVLVIPVQLLALARRPAALRRLVRALVVVAGFGIPLVVLAVARGSGQLFWVPRPSSRVDTQVLESITSAGLEPTFHRSPTTYLLIVVTLVTLGALLVWVPIARRRGEPVWALSLALGWFALPVSLTFVYSLISQPLFLPRNLLTSVPAVAIALALALSDRRIPRLVALAAVTGLIVLRALQVADSYGVSPEPWRQVTRTVLAQARPGDCIAFYPEDGRSAFAYYTGTRVPARAPRSILPAVSWGISRPYVEDYVTLTPAALRRRSTGCKRMWLISSHEGELDGPLRSRVNRARFRRLDSDLQAAFGAAPVQKYGYASAIHVQLLPGQGRRVVP
ncbi:MAG: glycosyltransferase family 39 protein [Solirubrobacteraceae bacterium]